VDGTAQRGDALGDRAGVFQQVFGEHRGMIAAAERARQPRRAPRLPS
jgi:hypothetical protein